MMSPPHLKKGDKIGLVSTARKISTSEIEPALSLLKSWGLVPVLGKTIDSADRQFAGDDALRSSDFQAMLDNDDVKAILCARGGYGTVRIIDKIDFSKFRKAPKWICGYSDISVLHSHIHTQFEIATIHSTMPINFPKNGSENKATQSLHDALFKGMPTYSEPNSGINKGRIGTGKGLLTGGNLSILYALTGSASDIDTSGKILFIEDLDEYLYHIDRMMLNLKRSGKLKTLAGLVVGGMSDMRDNAVPFGRTAEDIIMEVVEEYDYPVCFGFPAGHIDDNRALVMGSEVELIVSETEYSLKSREQNAV